MVSAHVIEAHLAAGRFFEAGRTRSFVREQGGGPAVLCLHGVPASCFLYRKVLAELSLRGLRGLAFDLPGLGLADRPTDFDYTWTGLGRFAVAAVDALELERFHLVVHDIGGPIGFELAAARAERVASLTVLNTMIEVAEFRKPWSMRPFGVPLLGRLCLMLTIKPAFRQLMFAQGIADRTSLAPAELDAYLDLLKREDGGEAFLKIMRGFETTSQKATLYKSVLRGVPYPVQVVWGAHDPALTLAHHGEIAKRVTGVELHAVPAKHFLQEDQAPAIAEHVATLARADSA